MAGSTVGVLRQPRAVAAQDLAAQVQVPGRGRPLRRRLQGLRDGGGGYVCRDWCASPGPKCTDDVETEKMRSRRWNCCDEARCTRSWPPTCSCLDKVEACVLRRVRRVRAGGVEPRALPLPRPLLRLPGAQVSL
uniref:Bowman-Birk serine protease inhibitors family domain-containing protein n=1 Tax=Oryza brachyantha TaxID=4533 RepID=J3KW14_ORYBR